MRDNRPVTKVANGIYSYLSPATLKEVRRCIAKAYPNYSAADKRRTYVTLACQPEAAIRFINHPELKA